MLKTVQASIGGKGKFMSISDFTVTTIDAETITLDMYRNQVLLIVNVASKCGCSGGKASQGRHPEE